MRGFFMSKTASTLIRDAYRDIGKGAAQQSIKPYMTDAAIVALNDLMASQPYNMGYTEITSGSDQITTPEYTWVWMRKALAIDLAPEFGVLESYPLLERQMQKAWSNIKLRIAQIPAPEVMDTVPMGSGNVEPGDCHQYYTETDDGVLSEQNAQIIVEDDT